MSRSEHDVGPVPALPEPPPLFSGSPAIQMPEGFYYTGEDIYAHDDLIAHFGLDHSKVVQYWWVGDDGQWHNPSNPEDAEEDWNFKQADQGWGGDSHPAEEPQAEADRQHVNDAWGTESGDNLGGDDHPAIDYKFVWANGEIDVSGSHEHEDLFKRNNVPLDHTGPTAVGNVTVQDGIAVWEVASNVGGTALKKALKKYTQDAGWAWGGMTDMQGDPIGNDEVKLAKVHLMDHELGEIIEIRCSSTFKLARAPIVTDAVRDWAKDFGYRLAEYPGGSNMNDLIRNNAPTGEDYEQKNIPMGFNEEQPTDRYRMPDGIYQCPDCGEKSHTWSDHLLHRQQHDFLQEEPVQDGKFPEVDEIANQEMRQEPGIHTGAHDARKQAEFYEALDERGAPYHNLWRTAEQQPKDMFKDPVPFVYDIKNDSIHVGHPGSKHHEIYIPHTPGGIIEGEYQPGGTVLLKSTTNMPFSIRHMLQVWYYTHPEFEITGVEKLLSDGSTHKLAANFADSHAGAMVLSQAAADPAVHQAWQALRDAGGKVYAVGGVVRDALLGKPAKDVDLMVTGLPKETVDFVLKKLPGKVDLTGKDFGVYRYNVEGHEVEIALPRVERSTGDRRVDFDVSVDHTLPVESDLLRRDFTANAVAVDLDSGDVVDPYKGAHHISEGKLKTVHPNSFREDPTRIVRGLVAYARHGLTPDAETMEQMHEHADALSKESPERIQAELEKLLKTDDPAKAILLAHKTGVLHYLLPEVDECFDFDQRNPHHNYDLGTHLLNVLTHTAKQTDDPDVRMAALLHDIGKPASQWIDPANDVGHYYRGPNGEGDDHETVGAQMAEGRLKQLRWGASGNGGKSKDRINRIKHLVQHHMYPDFSSGKGARKFIQRVGEEHANDLFVLRAADRAGKGTDDYQSTKTPVGQQKQLVEEALAARQPVGTSNLAINGNDLLGLGIQPGPALGEILRALTDVVVDEPAMNDKHTLLQYVRQELMPDAG